MENLLSMMLGRNPFSSEPLSIDDLTDPEAIYTAKVTGLLPRNSTDIYSSDELQIAYNEMMNIDLTNPDTPLNALTPYMEKFARTAVTELELSGAGNIELSDCAISYHNDHDKNIARLVGYRCLRAFETAQKRFTQFVDQLYDEKVVYKNK